MVITTDESFVRRHWETVTHSARGSRLVREVVTVWRDSLVRNSFYLMATMATTAGFGFCFWIINARLYTPSEVGTASSLVSAVSFLSAISLFGLNNTLVRLLPKSRDRGAEVGTAVALVLFAGLSTAAIYVAVLPLLAPKLDFVRTSAVYALGFIVISAATSACQLTDYVFIALRVAKYNFFIKGLLLGGTRVVLPFAFMGLGAYGIFAASGIAPAVALGVSLVVLARRLGIRPRLNIRTSGLRQTLGLSAATYVSNGFGLVPVLAVPLIVLHQLDSAAAGSYFIAFQIAVLMSAVPVAVSQTMFAEGSHQEEDLRALSLRSAALIALITTPVVVLVATTSHWLLLLFGAEYSERASGALVVLAISTLAVGFNWWVSFLLIETKQLGAMIVASLIYALSNTVLTYVWAPRGLTWVALAWGVGNLLCGIVSAGALLQRTLPRLRRDRRC